MLDIEGCPAAWEQASALAIPSGCACSSNRSVVEVSSRRAQWDILDYLGSRVDGSRRMRRAQHVTSRLGILDPWPEDITCQV